VKVSLSQSQKLIPAKHKKSHIRKIKLQQKFCDARLLLCLLSLGANQGPFLLEAHAKDEEEEMELSDWL